jgi:hypothetical protein
VEPVGKLTHSLMKDDWIIPQDFSWFMSCILSRIGYPLMSYYLSCRPSTRHLNCQRRSIRQIQRWTAKRFWGKARAFWRTRQSPFSLSVRLMNKSCCCSQQGIRDGCPQNTWQFVEF